MSLTEYARKRDFRRTPEPKSGSVGGKAGHRFVIQKHDASRLHYDFRLELGGTLKSWAVPKGPPYEKGEKRLAVHVEDHPVAYIDFEGTIPEGQYGGGTVMVWDAGTFEPLSDKPLEDLKKGKLHFILSGKKLKGEWYLVRLRDDENWLLIRGGESMRPVSKKQDDTSALSGQSMKELARGDRQWNSSASAKAKPAAKVKSAARRREAPLPEFVEPMKARLAEHPPHDGEWSYEIKFDGFRALALRGGSEVRLLSRNNKDLGGKFPEIMEAVSRLRVDDAVIDGEIVALDDQGRSSFQLLQAFEMGEERPPIFFYVFDLLRLDGKDLTSLPLEERKTKLQRLIGKKPAMIRFSDTLGGDPEPLLEQARKVGIEGLIGKRQGSHYEIGRRSGAWIKLKLRHEQEFVIGGYSPPGGTRKYFGALLVGVYEKKKLMFVCKVGTGFNHALLKSLHAQFARIARPDCPFANLPEKRERRYGQAITASEMKRCHWVEPVMVCQLEFAEWTRDNRLRQPVFLGIREDKDASEVIREVAK
jgi:bifunctional non-homologous end joining protein LigD